ncbi:hypothetical protein DOTSEDRAFT_53302 [Dothistroma septosporum NZE10]|uniref:Uncharacterized protein n=1 Tax=Dothistroma septosporum (strain NZE10 / CBS 128990) TaxID=675120 RepID=N1PL88_DOTSN|nr:hypothetical protein DOTSEDRAFT_53302 [Dothistroma septosporum NZE10]
MYTEARPSSTYQSSPGWSIPPLSPGKLKRPTVDSAAASSGSHDPSPRKPLQRPKCPGSGSSSSSLTGLEQTVPSFQSFIKRTPYLNSQKPLPPTPSLAEKRSEGSLIDSYFRRSSSIYSRAPSQWDAESIPEWNLEEVLERDPPPLLHPIAYSASTPDLRQRDDAAPLLEPRVFSPLIISPSPGISMIAADRVRSEVLAPVPPKTRQSTSSRQSLKVPSRPRAGMISLEQAKQALKAPGAVPLLPEELRAQALKTTRSHAQIRLDSIDIFAAGGQAPQLPPSATLVDPQGRRRTLLTPPVEIAAPAEEYPFLKITSVPPKSSVPYAKAFHVGSGSVRTMTPPTAHGWGVSRGDVGLFAQDNDSDVSRGRAKQRRTSRDADQADELAHAYHSIVTQQQARQASTSSAWSSDGSIRTRMKMIPQPLFHSKQLPRSRLPEDPHRSQSSLSFPDGPRRGHSGSSGSSGRRSTGFHLRLSPPTSTRASSITGVILISSPGDHQGNKGQPPPIDTSVPGKPKAKTLKLPKSKSHLSRDKSRDAFYPKFPRMKSSRKGQKKAKDLEQSIQPGKPLLAADIVALKLKTPESTPDISRPANSASGARTTGNDASSQGRVPMMWERVARNVAKSRRRSSNKSQTWPEAMSPGAFARFPDSPHLFPSPVKATTIHLGWTESTKKNFDEVHSPTHSPSRPHPTYIIRPPKSADDSKKDSAEERFTTTRRPSLFGGVLDSWRENKAQKRREDLKRMIRVVDREERLAPDQKVEEGDREVWTRPVLGLQRKLSEFGWV